MIDLPRPGAYLLEGTDANHRLELFGPRNHRLSPLAHGPIGRGRHSVCRNLGRRPAIPLLHPQNAGTCNYGNGKLGLGRDARWRVGFSDWPAGAICREPLFLRMSGYVSLTNLAGRIILNLADRSFIPAKSAVTAKLARLPWAVIHHSA